MNREKFKIADDNRLGSLYKEEFKNACMIPALDWEKNKSFSFSRCSIEKEDEQYLTKNSWGS
jgi:hypothetical protein